MVRVFDHPLLADGLKIALHRLKMINHLKRRLRRSEIVHHKDGNIANNHISNLGLMSHGEHSRHHQLGKKHPPEFGDKVRQRMLGFHPTGERLKKHQASMRRAGAISAAKRKGKPLTGATLENARIAFQKAAAVSAERRQGRHLSAATCKKLAVVTKQSWKDPKVRALRISNAKLAWTPERRKAQAERCRLVGQFKRRAK